MRDPKRIKPIMTELQDLWELQPDLRLCQLIAVLAGNANTFYLEDEDLSLRIYKRYAELENRPVGQRASDAIRRQPGPPWYCPAWLYRGPAAKDTDTELDG